MHAVYDELPAVLAGWARPRVQGVLFDLGVSSLQLDDGRPRLRLRPGRAAGHADGPDQRHHRRRGGQHLRRRATWRGCCGSTARSASPGGSPPRSSASARRQPFTSTARLAELVRDAIPAATRRTGGNPAKRTFQALRIEVNGELDALARALPAAVAALAVGGRIVVLSYQSLEDRMVKRVLAAGATSNAPADLPVVPAEHEPLLRLLTRGAEVAGRGRDGGQPARGLGAAARRRAPAGGRMSTLRTALPLARTGSRGRRLAAAEPLRTVVPQPRPRPARAPFVLLVLGLLLAGMVGLLLLNTALAEGSFVVHELKQRATVLADDEATLEQEVAVAASPAELAARAEELGMVRREPGLHPAVRRGDPRQARAG